jgi:hypothetical protein
MIKQETCINHRQFITLNAHDIEKYFVNLIKEQLGKCYISNPYNDTYDIYLSYLDKYYNIEIKSGKRLLPTKNGNLRNGYFKIHKKDIKNKADIFGFCFYYKENKDCYFVLGKNVIQFYKSKNFINFHSLTHNQFFKNLKPKLNIKDVIKNV